MFPSGLSLLGTGLMIMVAVLVFLYLIVLIKLNPPTGDEQIPRGGLSKQTILEETLAERREPTVFDEVREETIETIESIERQEPVSPAPVETEKTGAQGCPHYFGYLEGHPKNTPIPNECLTCIKIMECLSKGE